MITDNMLLEVFESTVLTSKYKNEMDDLINELIYKYHKNELDSDFYNNIKILISEAAIIEKTLFKFFEEILEIDAFRAEKFMNKVYEKYPEDFFGNLFKNKELVKLYIKKYKKNLLEQHYYYFEAQQMSINKTLH